MWAAVLIPIWLRRHDDAAENRSADRYSQAMRTLSRRPARIDRREMVMPARHESPADPLVDATSRGSPARRVTSEAPAAAVGPARRRVRCCARAGLAPAGPASDQQPRWCLTALDAGARRGWPRSGLVPVGRAFGGAAAGRFRRPPAAAGAASGGQAAHSSPTEAATRRGGAPTPSMDRLAGGGGGDQGRHARARPVAADGGRCRRDRRAAPASR